MKKQSETTTYLYLTNEPPLPITGVALNVPVDKDGKVDIEYLKKEMIKSKIK